MSDFDFTINNRRFRLWFENRSIILQIDSRSSFDDYVVDSQKCITFECNDKIILTLVEILRKIVAKKEIKMECSPNDFIV